MKRRHAILFALLVVSSSSVVFSHGPWKLPAREVATSPPTPPPTTAPTEQPAYKPSTELRVFAASSLRHVVEEHQERFDRTNNARLVANFASSSSLYAQICSGSPCDVFMSADFKWTKKLKSDGLLDSDQYWNFTTSRLIVILPLNNPRNITTLLDLVKPDTKIAVGAWGIPVGTCTNMTLTKIQKTWGNRSDPNYRGPQWEHYRDRIIKNIVSYEPMAMSITTKVINDVVDAGFVFSSEVKALGHSVKCIEIPSSVNSVGTFGIAVIKGTGNRELAVKYVNFWLSEDGQDLLSKHGFGTERDGK